MRETEGSPIKQVRLTVNGKAYGLDVQPGKTLLELIREDLGLTGTKEGCGLGECGACTVIMDGKTVNSCLVLAAEADGKQITTIEGLADGDRLHPVQQAFIDHGGLQCGFCTPGMIMSAKALLDENQNPSDEEIRKGISGNLCRCTGYTKIIESIKAAAGNAGGR
ncbi:MAG TPA: (2Fe-2S)-binding protein [Dehalococcoidia bacterium]|nr:(2Fe-2S)-binding protein [Dehalococcoidia bacterium]